MAFPTSPSNNQVHKEGARSFVYDSTAGVWDQIRTPSRTDSRLEHGSGTILSDVAFPVGHVVQVASDLYTGNAIAIGTTATVVKEINLKLYPRSSKNKIIIQIFLQGIYTTTNGAGLRAGIQWSTNNWASSATLGTSLYIGGYVNYGQGARKEHCILTTPILDMPSTAALIEFRIYCQMNSGTMNINQDGNGVDTTGMIGWEIQG